MRHTYFWLLQLITGALLFVFLGAHLVLMHLNEILGFFGVEIGEPASWISMAERAVQGFWLAFYIVFLALALYHALNGLRGVLLEITALHRAQGLVTAVIIALGIIALGLGIYVPADLFIA